MNSDLQNLIDLQEVDLQAAALKAEVAALPKHVAEIEAKLAGSQKKVQIAQAGMKADEASRRRYESEIQDQQQKIRKYRDQSLNVKTNPEYRALLNEIEHAEGEIRKLEDKILEIMVASDARKETLKATEAELKADTLENEAERESARRRTAEDEKQLGDLGERRTEIRARVSEDVLFQYDRVVKHRGSALAAVHQDQMCSACHVVQRPQVFQEIMSNEHILSCSSCSRILYYVPPPPEAEETKKKKKASKSAAADSSVEVTPAEDETADAGEATAR